MNSGAGKHPLRKAIWLLAGLGALSLAVWLAPFQHVFEGISRYQSVHLPAGTLIIVFMLMFGLAWNAFSLERHDADVVDAALRLIREHGYQLER